jgi:hypothetical protein
VSATSIRTLAGATVTHGPYLGRIGSAAAEEPDSGVPVRGLGRLSDSKIPPDGPRNRGSQRFLLGGPPRGPDRRDGDGAGALRSTTAHQEKDFGTSWRTRGSSDTATRAPIGAWTTSRARMRALPNLTHAWNAPGLCVLCASSDVTTSCHGCARWGGTLTEFPLLSAPFRARLCAPVTPRHFHGKERSPVRRYKPRGEPPPFVTATA